MTSNTSYATVRQADATDEQVVVDVLTEAFTNDPLVCWLFPDADERGRLQAHFYRPLINHPDGEAYLAGQDEGASVWLTPAAGRTADEEQGERGSVFGESGARLRALGQALAERHPDSEPHLYLPCMGVVSGRQGAGLGSALLRHRLERADRDGLAAYLEASSPRSRALYQRHGFEDLGEPVQVEDSPLLWPMWRRPAIHGSKGEQR
ncbi:GNAT family N-acetyltransferase [Actinomadura darangshiensis]|uniref:GNAT family N-acetyltransferase n=1 Tax=Actinomadura darangshiensis TaxID=705336 RepID=A0A4R5AFQ8_9ACTN|nr:GNAT family N-acetyltransferase [Actinomadura darangshiensis]TDD71428.1 GNAT family N-acetyltransferase [Actinomadura darangshiensis]